MADLRTTYMGIELNNPIVVGSCSLSKKIDTIKELQEAGVGAVVIKSLFEEQVQLEQVGLEETLSQYDDGFAEALSMFPKAEHGGAKEHLYWIEKTRKAVSLPLIGSLNANEEDVWITYARQLAETGVDGLELNFYSQPLDPSLEYGEIEKKELEIFAKVRASVSIPVAVKLHPNYTSVMKVAKDFDRLGANALILFNRLFQPDIDIHRETLRSGLIFSQSRDSLNSLRWTGLLHGRVGSDLVSSTGISTGNHVVAMILAGATAVQIASVLYEKPFSHVGDILAEIAQWMDTKGYQSLNVIMDLIHCAGIW